MKRLKLILYITFLPLLLWAKVDTGTAYRDSVLVVAKRITSDTARISYLQKMAYYHQYPPYNNYFATILYEEAKRQKSLFYENEGAYYMAGYYDKTHTPDRLEHWVEQLKTLAFRIGKYDYYLERKAALSRALTSKKQIESAVYIAKEVLNEAIERESTNGKIAAYNSLGCAYSVSSRQEQALELLLKAYREFAPDTKPTLKVEVLSRLTHIYGRRGDNSSKLFYLDQMRDLLQEIIAEEPETQNNWTDMAIDCEVKYALHYMGEKDLEQARRYIERAQDLLSLHVDSVFWLNIQLIRLQYYSRAKEYDKSTALIDEVTPVVLKGYACTFGDLISYKASTQQKKGDLDGALETWRYLIRAQDSLNNTFAANELQQVKDIYHIDELLLEKQKIKNTNYIWVFGTLLVLSLLGLLFYAYTRFLSGKIALAERAAAEAATRSEADNTAKERLKMEISHDVRTPLNAVVGFAELLSESEDLDKESKLSYGKIIQENAERLLEYVNNILELSRLESGKIQYKQEEVEIVQLCRNIVRLVNSQKIEGDRVVLKTSIKRQMVFTDKRCMVSLLRGGLTRENGSADCETAVYIDCDKKMGLLTFRIVGTLLAQENRKDKKILIRNEINSHFIRHFGGSYTMSTDENGVPMVIFTCPLPAQGH